MNPDQSLKILPADPSNPPEQKPQYAIRIKSSLRACDWSEWFGGMAVEIDATHGETRLVGPITDQAELYGLLNRLRNLGLILISVELLPTKEIQK